MEECRYRIDKVGKITVFCEYPNRKNARKATSGVPSNFQVPPTDRTLATRPPVNHGTGGERPEGELDGKSG